MTFFYSETRLQIRTYINKTIYFKRLNNLKNNKMKDLIGKFFQLWDWSILTFGLLMSVLSMRSFSDNWPEVKTISRNNYMCNIEIIIFWYAGYINSTELQKKNLKPIARRTFSDKIPFYNQNVVLISTLWI